MNENETPDNRSLDEHDQWRPYSLDSLKRLRLMLTKTEHRMIELKSDKSESGCLHTHQWALEALENINMPDCMRREILETAILKTTLLVSSLAMQLGYNPSNPPIIPRYVLAFLDKSDAELLLRPCDEDFERSNLREENFNNAKK